MIKEALKLITLFCTFLITPTLSAGSGFDVSGNYVYTGSGERLVLRFTEQGVVLFRRYEGGYTKTGMEYKSTPSESTWAPYLSDGENSAKALICQYGNPNRSCSAVVMNKLNEGDTVTWSGMSFKKTGEKFNSSRHDIGPFTFDELKHTFKARMHIISPK